MEEISRTRVSCTRGSSARRSILSCFAALIIMRAGAHYRKSRRIGKAELAFTHVEFTTPDITGIVYFIKRALIRTGVS